MYRVGWDCKDDLKLCKYVDPKVKFSPTFNKVFLKLSLWFRKERNKFTVAGNHKYEETDCTNSVQSSL